MGSATLQDYVPDALAVDGDGGDGFTLDDLPSEAGSADPYSDVDSGAVVTTPVAEQAAVEFEADEWAQQWVMGDHYTQPIFAIRVGAFAFPAGTGLGYDNVSPRVLARLSYEALMVLARILSATGALGVWGKRSAPRPYCAFADAGRGLQPIGLFPTIIRL